MDNSTDCLHQLRIYTNVSAHRTIVVIFKVSPPNRSKLAARIDGASSARRASSSRAWLLKNANYSTDVSPAFCRLEEWREIRVRSRKIQTFSLQFIKSGFAWSVLLSTTILASRWSKSVVDSRGAAAKLANSTTTLLSIEINLLFDSTQTSLSHSV